MQTMSKQKIWIVTGSSRGLGRAIVEGVAERGDIVVATARKTEDLKDLTEKFGDRVVAVSLDVTDPEQARRVIDETVAKFGRIDVLVNNAGYASTGAFEEQTPEQFAAQIDTNFWGVVHTTRAAIPVLRQQGHGQIFQISSVGGRRASSGLSGYQTAKFAVEGFSEVLYNELKPLGVRVTIVEPGGFRTDWSGASMDFAPPMPEYSESVGKWVEFRKQYAGTEPGDPSKAAAVLFELSRETDPPLRLVLGKFARQYVKEGYEANLAELEKWSHLTLATEFDEEGAQTAVSKIL